MPIDDAIEKKIPIYICIGCGEVVDPKTALDCGMWSSISPDRLEHWIPYYACNERCKRRADKLVEDWLIW